MGAYRAVVDALDDAGDVIYSSTVGKAHEGYEAKVDRVATKWIKTVEAYLMRFLEDPYMPGVLKILIRKTWKLICDEINPELRLEVSSVFHLRTQGIKKHRLDFWPDSPGVWWFGEPGTSFWDALVKLALGLRAKFLYAQMPADGSSWKVMRDPYGVLILALKMHPTSSVFAFLLTFVLMDRMDEYQLVRFILKFKATATVPTIISAVQLGMSYHYCLVDIHDGGGDTCIASSPSQLPSFPRALLFEGIRLALYCVGIRAPFSRRLRRQGGARGP